MDEILEIKKIKYNNRPDSVPYFYRLSYRTSITCLILKLTCRKNSSCSLTKLHLITTSLYTEKEMLHLIKKVNTEDYSEIILRFDPTVNNTLLFLIADRLIEITNNYQFILTERGEKFFNEIMEDRELLINEKKLLNMLSTKLTETKIKHISNLLNMR